MFNKMRLSDGFTIIELMMVVVVIGILAAIATPNYLSARSRAIDATMKSDLHGAMLALEDYSLQYGALPPDAVTLETGAGFDLSSGVTWDRFDVETVSGILSIHMHLAHPSSPNNWHANYPAEGNNIEIR